MDYNRRKSEHPPTSGARDVVKMEPFVTRQNQRKSFDGLRLVLWSTYKNLIFWRTVTSQQNAVCRRMCRKISPAVGLHFVLFLFCFSLVWDIMYFSEQRCSFVFLIELIFGAKVLKPFSKRTLKDLFATFSLLLIIIMTLDFLLKYRPSDIKI